MEGAQTQLCLLVAVGAIILCNGQHWEPSERSGLSFSSYRQPHQPAHNYGYRHRPPGAYNPWQAHHPHQQQHHQPHHHQQHHQQQHHQQQHHQQQPHNPWGGNRHHARAAYTAPEAPTHRPVYAEPAPVEPSYIGDCTYHGQYLAHPSSACRYLQCSDMSTAGWRTDDLPCPPGMAARPDLGTYGYPCKLALDTCRGDKPEPSPLPEPILHKPIYDANGQYIPAEETYEREVGHVNHAQHIPAVPEYHTVQDLGQDYEPVEKKAVVAVVARPSSGGFIEILHGTDVPADMLQTYHKITAVPPIAESLDVVLYEENKKFYEEQEEPAPNHSLVETMEDGIRMVVEEMHEDRPGYHMEERHTKKVMDNDGKDGKHGKKMEYSSFSSSKERSSEMKPEIKHEVENHVNQAYTPPKPTKAEHLRSREHYSPPVYSPQPDYGYSYGAPAQEQKKVNKLSFVHMPHIPQNIMTLLQGMKDMFARQSWGRR